MAQVPDVVAPDVAAQGVPDTQLNIPTNPNQFGAPVSHAVEKLGAAGTQATDTGIDIATQLQMQANAVDAFNHARNVSQKTGDIAAQFYTLQGENAYKAAPLYRQKLSDAIDQEAAQIGAPAERTRFLMDANNLASRAIYNMSLHAADQQKVALVNSLQSGIKEDQANVVRYTQPGQDPDFSQLVDHTRILAQQQGLDQDSMNVLIQDKTGSAIHDMITAQYATGNSAGADKVFQWAMNAKAPGTDLPLLSAATQAQITQQRMMQSYRDAAIEGRNTALSDKMMRDNQAKNFGSLYSRALGGDTPSIAELQDATSKQLITPPMADAIIATANGRRASADDPASLAPLLVRANRGGDADFSDDVANLVTMRKITGQTADGLLKTASARQEKGDDAVERASFATLRSYMGLDANMQPMINFGGEEKATQVGLWTQAQSEWTKRVLQNGERPGDVLPDMMAEYSRASMPQASLPAPKFGAVTTKDDLPAIAQQTQQALDSGALTPEQFSHQQHLLLMYKAQFDEQARKAQLQQSVPKGKGVKPKPGDE